MSYERQIQEPVELEGVDVTYLLGVPRQGGAPDETMEPLLGAPLHAPLSAQRLGPPKTGTELLAEAGIVVGVGLPDLTSRPSRNSLDYDPTLGYDTSAAIALTGGSPADRSLGTSALGGADLDTTLVPILNRPLPQPGSLLTRKGALGLGVVALAVIAGLGALALTSPGGGAAARANGGATAAVLAKDLGVTLGTYGAGGLPVTLTNTAHHPQAYNVTVEALDAAGRRVSADVAFVGTLAPGQSTVTAMFAAADAPTAAELGSAQFHVVEASAY